MNTENPHPVTEVFDFLGSYKVEISNTVNGFRHRIVNKICGAKSQWAGYASISVLDDMRHCTHYFNGLLPEECLFSIAEIEPISLA